MENRTKKGGRQKGTPNKTTNELRNAIKNIVDSQMETIEQDIKKLTPFQRIDLTIKLMQYCLPKVVPSNDIVDNKIEVIFQKGKTIL